MMKKIMEVLCFVLISICFLSSAYASSLVPQTGQSTCYDPSGMVISCSDTATFPNVGGEDGAIQAGVAWPAPRFADNGDQTQTDNLTGLVWAKDAGSPILCADGSTRHYGSGYTPCPGAVLCDGGTKIWQNALYYVACLNQQNYLGHNDWRMPNINELESLVNAGQTNPAAWLTDEGFNNVSSAIALSGAYWSSTSDVANPFDAFFVTMGNGGVYSDPKDIPNVGGVVIIPWNYVWPVRGNTSNSPAPVWQTGQSTCFDSSQPANQISCESTGQDGELQLGVWSSPRFNDAGDGTVLDNLTGLMWTQDNSSPAFDNCSCVSQDDAANICSWQDALGYVACLNQSNYLGYNDWRLPNRKELYSLVDFSQNFSISFLPAINPFTMQESQFQYWSSTSAADIPSSVDSTWSTAWIVNGMVTNDDKNAEHYAWPVRGGTAGPGGPVNGVCGSANGQGFFSTPAADLCSTGTASAVTWNGLWNWSCAGLNGGASVSCYAYYIQPKAMIDSTPYASLFAAYSATTGNTVIKLLNIDLQEGFFMSKGYTITLKGGYNADFLAQSGTLTAITGPLRVKTDVLKVSKVRVKYP